MTDPRASGHGSDIRDSGSTETPSSVDDDLREAVEQRLAERLEAAAQRRDRRRRRLTDLSERRRYGVQQRHAGKLARAREDEAE